MGIEASRFLVPRELCADMLCYSWENTSDLLVSHIIDRALGILPQEPQEFESRAEREKESSLARAFTFHYYAQNVTILFCLLTRRLQNQGCCMAPWKSISVSEHNVSLPPVEPPSNSKAYFIRVVYRHCHWEIKNKNVRLSLCRVTKGWGVHWEIITLKMQAPIPPWKQSKPKSVCYGCSKELLKI